MMKVIDLCSLVLVVLFGEAYAAPSTKRPEMLAPYTDTPVLVDGALSEAIWEQATAYPLTLSAADEKGGRSLQEGGQAQVAWDDHFLYVAIHYIDSDIVAEGKEDQMYHFEHGDLAEVFLKPEGNTWYWELYAMPSGLKTHLFFPGIGRIGLKSAFDYPMELEAAAQCQGTLNQWQDKDSSWTAEMAIPIKELTRHGDRFDSDSPWTIFIGRYNYSRFLSGRGAELTMTPKLPFTSFHHHAGYARLVLRK